MPTVWAEFFEIYYKKEVNRIAKLYEEGIIAPLYVDVKKDLVWFREGKIFEELIEHPDEVIRHASVALEDVQNIYDVQLKGVPVRFRNIPKPYRIKIRDIRLNYVNKFISVEGVVKRVSINCPYVKEAFFECVKCGRTVIIQSLNGKIPKPDYCECGSKSFRRATELDKEIEFQHIVIQELPEGLDSQPREISVYLYDDLVNKVNPGDKVIINGILREKRDKLKSHGQYFIEANSIEFLENDIRDLNITEEDKKKIRELASDPNIYDKLVKSIAPNIYGYEDIKLAVALQLFGGVPKELPDGTRIRGDIHILLVGDPSTAKSQILRYVYRVAPRAVLNTGARSSGAGLTAATVKDEIDGKWVLEAGTLVLADKGIAVLDELEKLSKEDKEALLEPLEQQTVTVTKAGINATLNARCAVLAAANPKLGRFNKYEPLVDQIKLDPPLLSRFDLIFTIFDEPDENIDAKIAKAVFEAHTNPKKPEIDPVLLKKYVVYARKNVKPKWPEELERKLVEFYVGTRKAVYNDERGIAIPITVRQLEAIMRLAEASARVRLSDVVTEDDVKRAIKLMMKSLEHFAVDPETGNIDIDYAFTGVSAAQRDRIAIIKEIIRELETKHERGAPEEDVIKKAEEKGISKEKVEEILKKLKEFGEVYCPRYGYYRLAKV